MMDFGGNLLQRRRKAIAALMMDFSMFSLFMIDVIIFQRRSPGTDETELI